MKKQERKTAQIVVRLEPAILKKIQQIAKENDVSVSEAIRFILQDFVDK